MASCPPGNGLSASNRRRTPAVVKPSSANAAITTNACCSDGPPCRSQFVPPQWITQRTLTNNFLSPRGHNNVSQPPSVAAMAAALGLTGSKTTFLEIGNPRIG